MIEKIQNLAAELGISQVGFANTDLSKYKSRFLDKLAEDNFGEMTYMTRNVDKRLNPGKLHPQTSTIITARFNYFPEDIQTTKRILADKSKAYISRYALGRDYHKVFRSRLGKLAENIKKFVPGLSYRVFADSAPVMELALAQKSNLGWVGKNSCIINKTQGSWFFLGEIFTNLDLSLNENPSKNHCGTCDACLRLCPTKAFKTAYELDVKKCISYLTIEYSGVITEELRPKMGNRIYGCDDCQLACPWNRFAPQTREADFKPRHRLANISLLELWQWDEADFLEKLKGSAIRRIGFEKWQRNLAIAIGNSTNKNILGALKAKNPYSEITFKHIDWAISRLSKLT